MNSDSYHNSAQLARECPPIRCSHPAALDNTQRFNHDAQRMDEPAKIVLCFDCQKPIDAGKGIQMTRELMGNPMVTLVHPGCQLAREVPRGWDHT
jgi:hypothetical protein